MSDYDFPPKDLPPKKRVTTYGKAARRVAKSSGNGLARSGDSATEVSASSIASTSHSASPEPQHQPQPQPPPRPRPRPATSTSKIKFLTGGGASRKARPAAPPKATAKESHSQPVTGSSSVGNGLLQDEDVATKRRKLTRTYSERHTGADDPYAIPDDSPPSRPRSPIKRAPPKVAQEEVTPKPSRVAKPVANVARTPTRDVVMEDADEPPMLFSAKTSKTLDRLSVSAETPPPKPKQQFPLRLSREQTGPAPPVSKKRPSPPGPSSNSRSTAQPGQRKKRLIDALAAQADSEESEDIEEDTIEEQVTDAKLSIQQPEAPPRPRPMIELTFRDTSPAPTTGSQASRSTARPAASAKKAGPKFTYSERRTMLQEDDFLLGAIDEEATGGAMFNFGLLPQASTISRFSFLDEEDETMNTGAVRSLHELRQAGANSRFADEMDDIMDRIGSPSTKTSSLRRGALLELAQKMKSKEFRRQFRNHGDEGNLFKSLGNEADLISGYSIFAVLVTLLAASSSAHLVQQLRAQNFAVLLARLLGEPTDIVLLTKDRKQNASRNAQTTLASIKAALLALPIWEPCSPTSLSPRTLALKCLDLIMLQPGHSSDEAEIFSPAVTDVLFSILSTAASSERCWDFPAQQESTDLYLTLYMLEGQSVSAMESGVSSRWTRQYVPVVVKLLETALHRPIHQFNDLENLTLRVTLNMTNKNADGARMFADQGLLQQLAASAGNAFDAALNSMKTDDFLGNVNDTLILMLGVMVNFCVYYPPASQNLEDDGNGEGSPLGCLIRVFTENHSKTSDADSMEKVQLNVALGYLSILLGYLCLREPIRDRFLAAQPKKAIAPLLDAINEFIAINNKLAEAQQSQFGATARLQMLIAQLQHAG